MSTCLASFCPFTVPGPGLACSDHWRELPEILRAELRMTAQLEPDNVTRLHAVARARKFWRGEEVTW